MPRHAPCPTGWARPSRCGWTRIPCGSFPAPCPWRRESLSGSVVWCSLDESADALARDRVRDGAVLVDVEHDERKLVLRTERDRGLIHHAQVLQHDVAVANRVVESRRRIRFGIGRVDAIN